MTGVLHDVAAVYPQAGYGLRVVFDDAVEGVVDVETLVPLVGIFEPLRDPRFFQSVTVHPELGVVCWPNGADLDSDVLYAIVTRAQGSPRT
jgi:hypothetical protein